MLGQSTLIVIKVFCKQSKFVAFFEKSTQKQGKSGKVSASRRVA